MFRFSHRPRHPFDDETHGRARDVGVNGLQQMAHGVRLLRSLMSGSFFIVDQTRTWTMRVSVVLCSEDSVSGATRTQSRIYA